jgi:SpoVK/Ycf46/Vps4 family AAA+-type ATPase
MGDNANRGKVLWVAASNRPDFVDAALISRFDRVIPFLLPDRANREEILLHAMPKIVKLEWIDGSEVASWPSESQTIWNQLLDLTEEFSGRELELILRRGIELADGRRLIPSCVLEAVQKFEHSHDRDVYQLQTLLALQVTNFKDYLPDPESLSPRDLAEKITSQVEGQSIIDRGKVQESIAKLRRRIR